MACANVKEENVTEQIVLDAESVRTIKIEPLDIVDTISEHDWGHPLVWDTPMFDLGASTSGISNNTANKDPLTLSPDPRIKELEAQIKRLQSELEYKEKVIRDVVRGNKYNVAAAKENIQKQQRLFQAKTKALQFETNELKSLNSKLLDDIKKLQFFSQHQNKRIQTLNQKLEQASALPKVGETKWKVFYPSVPHLSDNGVFVLDESGQSSLCIKLPLNVKMENDRIKVQDEDVSEISKAKVKKRQSSLLQVVDLLFNPMNTSMPQSRCQHLIWVLMMEVWNKYGFKAPEDKYLLRSNDSIVLKPNLVIKTYRPDLDRHSSSLSAMTSSKHLERSWEIKAALDPSLPRDTPPKPAPGHQRPLLGPKSEIMLTDDCCIRDVTSELELLRAARWNSSKSMSLMKNRNAGFDDVISWHIPGVTEPKQNLPNTVIGFLPAMEHSHGLVYIPFLIMPKAETLSDSKVVRSDLVTKFVFGKVSSASESPVKCPTCQRWLRHPDLVVQHMQKEHGTNLNVSVTVASEERKVMSKPIESPSADLWAVAVKANEVSFPSSTSKALFILESKASPSTASLAPERTDVKIKEESDSLFGCRFCTKRFKSVRGWDCHVDSHHSDLNPYLCPNPDCLFVCGTRMALQYHAQFHCLIKPRTIIAESSLPSKTASDPLSSSSLAKSSDSTLEKVPIDPKDEPVRAKKEDKVKVTLPRSPEKMVDCEGSKGMKRKSDQDDRASSANEISLQNKVKRRERHPQVRFTTLLKDIVKSVSSYISTTKVVLAKERGYSLKRSVFSMVEIDEKVDKDSYGTINSFLEAFTSLCQSVKVKHEADDIIAEVCNDLILFCRGEIEIRRPELESLEEKINPLLSSDTTQVFKHVLLKILDEDVMSLKVSHHFKKAMTGPGIKKPIGLDGIKAKVINAEYESKAFFIQDFALLFKNVKRLHGAKSTETDQAHTILNAVKVAVNKYKSVI